MRPISRILVAIKDPSARSQPAAEKAIQLARALGAEVRLFHALSEPLRVDARDADRVTELQCGRRNRALGQLEWVAERLGSDARVTVAAEWDYPSYEAVIRAAERFQAALIVAGAHKRVRRMPWLVHRADFELLRQSSVPVLLVKRCETYARPAVIASLEASDAQAKSADLQAEVLRYGSTIARALGGALKRPGRHFTARHLADALAGAARELEAGIVVMGEVSCQGIKALAMRSPAQKLLDRLSCDLLVVKSKDFPDRIPVVPRGAQLIVHSGVQAGY